MAGPLRGGGGGLVKGWAIKEKNFFWTFFFNVPTAIKRPLREELFFAASLSKVVFMLLYFMDAPEK